MVQEERRKGERNDEREKWNKRNSTREKTAIGGTRRRIMNESW